MSDHLHTVYFSKETQALNPQEKKYWLHFLQGDPLVGDYIKSQINKNKHMFHEVLDQPVCTKCESFCFYDKGYIMCPACGARVLESKSHTVLTHLKEGYYK